MSHQPISEALELIDEYANQYIRGGFKTESEIVSSVIDIVNDEQDVDNVDAVVATRVHALLQKHLEVEATWPAVTDNDKLDAGFAALEAKGIVARQDFSCCGTCGNGEIRDEMAKLEAQGVKVRGYTFYHMQGTEHGIEGHGLFLSYGSTKEGTKAAVEIANEICATLKAQGLTVDWNGTTERCIHVPLEWKRRFKR